MSKYGKVEVANTHRFMEEVQGCPITPCLKEAMVYLAQSELYTEAPHVFELLTGQNQSQSTCWRLAQDCGQELEALLEQEQTLREGIRELDKKLLRLEERFIEEEISRELFEKYRTLYREGKGKLVQELAKVDQELSNREEYIQQFSVKNYDRTPVSDLKIRHHLLCGRILTSDRVSG